MKNINLYLQNNDYGSDIIIIMCNIMLWNNNYTNNCYYVNIMLLLSLFLAQDRNNTSDNLLLLFIIITIAIFQDTLAVCSVLFLLCWELQNSDFVFSSLPSSAGLAK